MTLCLRTFSRVKNDNRILFDIVKEYQDFLDFIFTFEL